MRAGPGSGTGPGNDFVRRRCSPPVHSEDIGTSPRARRRRVSACASCSLHLNPTAPVRTDAADASVVRGAPARTACITRGRQRRQFELSGGAMLSVEWPPEGGPDLASAAWRQFWRWSQARAARWNSATRAGRRAVGEDRAPADRAVRDRQPALGRAGDGGHVAPHPRRGGRTDVRPQPPHRAVRPRARQHALRLLRRRTGRPQGRSGAGVPAERLGNSPTLSVIRAGRPALGPRASSCKAFGFDENNREYGPGAADRLGVPMVADGAVRGAIVVQSYDQPNRQPRTTWRCWNSSPSTSRSR